MIPTERGKVLYNAITEPLAKLEEVEKNFQKSTEKLTPTISVGMCFETFQTTLEQYVSVAIQSDHQFRRIPRNARSIR
jgi:hypothetical protein